MSENEGQERWAVATWTMSSTNMEVLAEGTSCVGESMMIMVGATRSDEHSNSIGIVRCTPRVSAPGIEMRRLVGSDIAQQNA